MSDIVVHSRFAKEETVRRLRHIFRKGNSLGVEMESLHGEHYLSPEPRIYMGAIPRVNKKSSTIESLFVQLRVKEHKQMGIETSTIHITPQSRAILIALGSMFLSMAWILIVVFSLAEKRWLEKEIYLGGVALTLLMILYFRLSGSKEKQVIQRIVQEFE